MVPNFSEHITLTKCRSEARDLSFIYFSSRSFLVLLRNSIPLVNQSEVTISTTTISTLLLVYKNNYWPMLVT